MVFVHMPYLGLGEISYNDKFPPFSFYFFIKSTITITATANINSVVVLLCCCAINDRCCVADNPAVCPIGVLVNCALGILDTAILPNTVLLIEEIMLAISIPELLEALGLSMVEPIKFIPPPLNGEEE